MQLRPGAFLFRIAKPLRAPHGYLANTAGKSLGEPLAPKRVRDEIDKDTGLRREQRTTLNTGTHVNARNAIVAPCRIMLTYADLGVYQN
jgi:hypothetical protein